jgi:formylmethanofuran dehydrogenase subunit B
MDQAWIGGEPVRLEAAIAEAARLLAASRLPVIAGLGTDIAGARAAVALADRIGGVVDHMHSDALLRDLSVMREAGAFVTTPNEARLRGDTLLLVGPGLMEAWPALDARLLQAPLGAEIGGERRVFWLCPGKPAAKSAIMPGVITPIGRTAAELPALLGVLRAHIAGRPAGKVAKPIADLAGALQAARFGVAVWSAQMLDELTIEMLFGLIKDLNAKTRFTGLPLAAGDNAAGVQQACGWMTGFPARTGFGRGYPEHDPWRFDARRLAESREADCALWVSAYRPAAPNWKTPTIALSADALNVDAWPSSAQVHIQVGRPALDHDAVEHDATTGMLVARAAGHKSALPSVAEAIARIAAALPPAGAWPC